MLFLDARTNTCHVQIYTGTSASVSARIETLRRFDAEVCAHCVGVDEVCALMSVCGWEGVGESVWVLRISDTCATPASR